VAFINTNTFENYNQLIN